MISILIACWAQLVAAIVYTDYISTEYFFIAITLRYTLPGLVVRDRTLSMCKIELFGHLTICKQIINRMIHIREKYVKPFNSVKKKYSGSYKKSDLQCA